MGEFSELCIETFLKKQGQLFPRPVAKTAEEAEEFLEDCMAVVVKSKKELKAYLDEIGVDLSEVESLDEIAEVFPLADGTYLIVEA